VEDFDVEKRGIPTYLYTFVLVCNWLETGVLLSHRLHGLSPEDFKPSSGCCGWLSSLTGVKVTFGRERNPSVFSGRNHPVRVFKRGDHCFIFAKMLMFPSVPWDVTPKRIKEVTFKQLGCLLNIGTHHWTGMIPDVLCKGNGLSNGGPPSHPLSFSSFLKGETKTVGGGCTSFLGHQPD
jgi:hypothetical protein